MRGHALFHHSIGLCVLILAFGISLPVSAQTPPLNDDFVNAEIISGDGTWFGTNVDATSEIGEPFHAVSGGASVWFQWTAVADGYLTVDTFGSDYDSTLAMYTGSAVDALTQLAADDDTGGAQSQLSNVPINAGVTYHIAVDGYLGSTGQITLNWLYWDGTDVTAPTASIFSPIEGPNYVVNAMVLANYSCMDEPLGSGVASCVGDVPDGSPIDTTTEGTHTFNVAATDVAGNIGSAAVNYSVSGNDLTAPVVTIVSPVDGVSVSQGGFLIADYSCVDEAFGTGIASCAGDIASGAAFDTSVLGAFNFKVTGTDNAGNSTVETVTYNIVMSPPNDNFSAATVLSLDGTLSDNNSGATKESGEPLHSFNPGGASLWYMWTAVQDGFLTIDTFGSDFNTVLAVYEGSSVDALTTLAYDDNTGGLQSHIPSVPVTAGNSYMLAVDGANGATGNIVLNWSWADQFDTVPPTITFWSPWDGRQIAQGELVWSGYSCFDPAPSSGLVSCVGNIPSGQLIDTSIPGVFDFTVTANDVAGNANSITHSYTVIQNPVNDDFAAAISISGNGTLGGTNAGATYEIGEPGHGGFGSLTSVWYQYTPAVDGFLTVDTFGSEFDTVLAIYTGNAVDALTQLDSNDDMVWLTSELKNIAVTAGVTYSIAVSGSNDEFGPFTLNWSFDALNDTTAPSINIAGPAEDAVYMEGVFAMAFYTCTDDVLGSGVATCNGDIPSTELLDTSVSGVFNFSVTSSDNVGNTASKSVSYSVIPMSNDHFANALPLTGARGKIVASTIGATKEIGEPDHAGDTGGASVWFSWVAPEDGFLAVETYFSDFDTTLGVYSGSDVSALTELASSNDELGDQSRVEEVPVVMGQIYYFAVDGVAGVTGQIDLDWSLFTGPTFTEVSPPTDPLWVTDAQHDFWLNSAAPVDIDGDGDIDLAVIGFFVEYNVSVEHRLVVFLNDGPGADGNWQFSTQEVPMNGLFAGSSDLAWGDFDNDGDPDLVVGSEGATEIYRNDGGTLVPISTDLPGYYEDSGYTGAYDLRSLTWADYDNDADLDLLIPSVYNSDDFVFETKLMRNDGDDGAGGWLFSEVNTPLNTTIHAQTVWADNDGDGDLDLFMANVDNFLDNGYVRLFENDNGAFVSSEPAGSVTIEYGLGDWSDYDADGDLDILIVGLIQDIDGIYKTVVRIYDNENGNFVDNTLIQSSFFPWLDLHAATWADYDSDGDVDILITGSTIGPDNIEGKSEVYVNEAGVFVPLGRDLPAPIGSSGRGGSFTWFDVDGDGDLDYFVAGAYYVEGGNNLIEAQMHLYRNDAIDTNNRPQAPSTVQSSVVDDTVNLSWTGATDDSTPTQALTYQLDIAVQGSGQSASASRIPEPGNISAATNWTLQDLAPGTYTWSLRSVDSAFNGSVPAQGTFTIGGGIDTDSDGVADTSDNCTLVSNPDQRDSDADGYGNFCDPDFDNNGVVNFLDMGYFSNALFSNDPHADLNGDGIVNFLDFPVLVNLIFMPPGPSWID